MFKRIWIDETVDVATSADTLHQLLKDVDGWPSWTPGLKAIVRKSTQPVGVGSKFTMLIGSLRLPCEVFVYEPSKLEWGGGLGPWVIRHSFEITPTGTSQCRLRHLEYATGLFGLLTIPFEKALYAYDHRWTNTIRKRFAS